MRCKVKPMELICWEEATPQHHPKQFISVLLHIPEEENEGFPAVREGYWIDYLEGYYVPAVGMDIKVDHWANMPKGPHHNAPTIEAKPIVHAHWEEVREGCHICSNCKVKASLTSDEYDYMEDLNNYCPNCGARMDEVIE